MDLLHLRELASPMFCMKEKKKWLNEGKWSTNVITKRTGYIDYLTDRGAGYVEHEASDGW